MTTRASSASGGDELAQRDEVAPRVGVRVRCRAGLLAKFGRLCRPYLEPQAYLVTKANRGTVVQRKIVDRHGARLGR